MSFDTNASSPLKPKLGAEVCYCWCPPVLVGRICSSVAKEWILESHDRIRTIGFGYPRSAGNGRIGAVKGLVKNGLGTG
jgi:hypothetical protein